MKRCGLACANGVLLCQGGWRVDGWMIGLGRRTPARLVVVDLF
jgi:hypothetical protein